MGVSAGLAGGAIIGICALDVRAKVADDAASLPASASVSQTMALEINLPNVDEVVTRIGKMMGHISYFANVEMRQEFNAWQTQDLHRSKGRTKGSKWRRHAKSVTTIIRPHSWYETQRSQAYQTRLQRKLRRRKKPLKQFIQLRTSMRPILRESVYAVLPPRMQAALNETLTWNE
jgi:hypothetical protein